MQYAFLFLFIEITMLFCSAPGRAEICAAQTHCEPFLTKCILKCEDTPLGTKRSECRQKCRKCENYEYKSCMESAGCTVPPCPIPITPPKPSPPPPQICAAQIHCEPFLTKCILKCEDTPLGTKRSECRQKCRKCENYEYRTCMESAGCTVPPCPMPKSPLPGQGYPNYK
jgi:hypothetical protein